MIIPEKHRAVAHAWVDGAIIEWRPASSDQWHLSLASNQSWFESYSYRVVKLPSIDWDQVSTRFIAMATDIRGDTYLFTKVPRRTGSMWTYDSDALGTPTTAIAIHHADVVASFRKGTCDWTNSLVLRNLRPDPEASSFRGRVPKKHRTVAHAWVDGAKIEYKDDVYWKGIDSPTWMIDCEYRVAKTPPSIDWDKVDPSMNYLAVDADGRQFFYSNKPRAGYTKWIDGGLSRPLTPTVLKYTEYTRGTCGWRDSLISRPAVEQNCEPQTAANKDNLTFEDWWESRGFKRLNLISTIKDVAREAWYAAP